MDYIPAQCAAKSLGPANQLVNLLIQTLVSSYCTISDPGWPPNCGNPINEESFDFVVVGAGTSGSVVASRLSENSNFKVLVLEAGGDPPIESIIPGESASLEKTAVDWQYYAETKRACLATTNQKCFWPRGKMLGGSSSINSMFYARGNQHNFDYWESLGNTIWNYENVLKYMKRWEGNRDLKIADYDDGYYHNRKGPLNVKYLFKSAEARTFLEAALETGHKCILDINADEPTGYVHLQGFIYDGVRQSAATAYLIPAKNRPNLCIRKFSHVYKILFDENKRAIGVQYNYNGTKNYTVYARKEIILSAGTVESPHLLLLSGIGPKDELDRFNIPTISDLPVGKTLFEQLWVFFFFRFEGEPSSPTESLDDIYDYFIHRSGPLTGNGAIHIEGFVNTKNNSRWPDVEYACYCFPQNSTNLIGLMQLQDLKPEIQETVIGVNEKHHICVNLAILLQPKSVGFIRLNSTSYTEHPIIDANHFDRSEDEETMIRSMREQIANEKTKAFKKRDGKFIRLPLTACDGFEYKSKSYYRCYIHQMSMNTHHAVGTCKMGPKGDPTSVVSQKLLVRGVKGLSEADLGVAPYLPSGHTNPMALMIGEKAADFIKSRHSNS